MLHLLAIWPVIPGSYEIIVKRFHGPKQKIALTFFTLAWGTVMLVHVGFYFVGYFFEHFFY